jgi:hypothetical protein
MPAKMDMLNSGFAFVSSESGDFSSDPTQFVVLRVFNMSLAY